ncbi:MAG: hypothetical protein ABR573_08320 [Candidatus Dormibacteria bacterium]
MFAHIPELVQSRHIQGQVHGGGAIGRFNAALAVRITGAVGTMWCAYLFTILALVGLPSALDQMKTQGPLPLVQWIAQTFLQLVLLSVIIVGQNVIQAANDKRAEADHETLTALHKMNVQQLKILEQQDKILGLLKTAVVK